jgi:hypothetical protein
MVCKKCFSKFVKEYFDDTMAIVLGFNPAYLVVSLLFHVSHMWEECFQFDSIKHHRSCPGTSDPYTDVTGRTTGRTV